MKIAEHLEKAEKILSTPTSKLAFILGAVLVVGSFCDYDMANGFGVHGTPHGIMFGVGGLFVVGSILVYYVPERRFRKSLNYRKGVSIKRGDLTITVKEGEIQSICDISRTTAIVLPIASNFDVECVSDARGALGAFFLKHFPDRLATATGCFKRTLASAGVVCDSAGAYPPGTTILLPAEYQKPAKILISASTIETPNDGIS